MDEEMKLDELFNKEFPIFDSKIKYRTFSFNLSIPWSHHICDHNINHPIANIDTLRPILS